MQTALPETKNPDIVSTTVKAFMTAPTTLLYTVKHNKKNFEKVRTLSRDYINIWLDMLEEQLASALQQQEVAVAEAAARYESAVAELRRAKRRRGGGERHAAPPGAARGRTELGSQRLGGRSLRRLPRPRQ